MKSRLRIEGNAIVSADGMIADSHGLMPPGLRNDEDWQQFQAWLDAASLVVLGRLGHDRHPNRSNRFRLVLSSGVADLESRDGAMFWNPQGLPWPKVTARLGLEHGIVAVTGGRKVFDAFLPLGFDAFTLVEVEDFVLPTGVSCFSGGHPRRVLAAHKLVPTKRRPLAGDHPTILTQWQRITDAPGAAPV